MVLLLLFILQVTCLNETVRVPSQLEESTFIMLAFWTIYIIGVIIVEMFSLPLFVLTLIAILQSILIYIRDY